MWNWIKLHVSIALMWTWFCFSMTARDILSAMIWIFKKVLWIPYVILWVLLWLCHWPVRVLLTFEVWCLSILRRIKYWM